VTTHDAHIRSAQAPAMPPETLVPATPVRSAAKATSSSYLLTPRSTAPVDMLSRRLDAVCTHAVSALEIAAALEADGISDQRCREDYGYDDVFGLATELYSRVPLRTTRYTGRRVFTNAPGRNIARGLLFALPGLFYFVVEPMFPSRAAPVALLLAVMAGWGISQVMAIIGHTLVGRGNRSGAGVALGLILIGGLGLMATAGGLAAMVTGWNHNLVAACFTQTLYIMSAAALLLFERDRLLWISLVPGVVVSVAYLAGNPLGLTREVAVGAIVIAMALTFGSAVYTADRAHQDGPRTRARLGRADAFRAVQFGIYGVLLAALLAAPMLHAAATHSPEDSPSLLGAAMVPLVLSMGVAEWQLASYADRRNRAMDLAPDIETFSKAAWRNLLVAAATHAAALFALTFVTAVGIAIVAGHVPTDVAELLVAYLFLGAAVFMALVLTTWGRISMLLPILALAVAAVWLPALASPHATQLMTIYLIASAVLAGCLLALGWREVRIVSNHGA
jgi:hypothetical protein